MRRNVIGPILIVLLGISVATAVGLLLGVHLAETQNFNQEILLQNQEQALPSRVLDRNGDTITEFFAEEKRELVTLDELPPHLIEALITREDKTFFEHPGFSVRGLIRAALGILTGNYWSGGSSITQQLAKVIYIDDPYEMSIRRKLVELWYAFQIERLWTKEQILEEYLNRVWFGHNTYGVEAASSFYFGHSARDLTVAESVMLVIQLNGANYSPIRYPDEARRMQRNILDQMVDRGFLSNQEAEESFRDYWDNYDFTRSTTTTAYFEQQNRAPHFSVYVRTLLENEYLLGAADLYRDGFIVHTTLDLAHQETATRLLRQGINSANVGYRESAQTRTEVAATSFVPVIDLLAFGFDVPALHLGNERNLTDAREYYATELNDSVEALALLFGQPDEPLRELTQATYENRLLESEGSTVEGAMITIENSTGYITAMVGGSRFEYLNQFNRAVDGQMNPGSSFKPLYYAAAIEKGVITPATMFLDAPIAFALDDGTYYTPRNYRGTWEGPVLARHALATSMNVPSLQVLDRVGFTDAIDTTSALLGIPERELLSRGFVRKYPIGLGTVSVAPLNMARAFAVFPNRGRLVEPLAVRYIEDRNGRVVIEPELDLREDQRRRGDEMQILSEQTAYIMTDLLQTTVRQGTLASARWQVGGFGDMPMAGKTGTHDNWADVWTVGFSPYYTTAVWLGFDRAGDQAFATWQTGATVAGPIWARYMKAIHEGLEPREYYRPSDGLVEVEVTARTGQLPPPDYSGATITEIFRVGTEPTEFDNSEEFARQQREILLSSHQSRMLTSDVVLDASLGQFGLSTELELPAEIVRIASTPSGYGSGDDSPWNSPDDTIDDSTRIDFSGAGDDDTDGNPLLD